MTTATVTNNKPPRKQLSDQLDRLDGILDALSEGLNGAVADAAREGTRLALKDAIVEIMTDPNLRTRLHEATAPGPAETPTPTVKKPGFWARWKTKAGEAVAAVGRAAAHVVDGAVRGVRALSDGVAEGVRSLQGLGSLKRLAVVGLGVGTVLGMASLVAPHVVAAGVSAISGAIAAAAVQVGLWTRRTFRAFTMT